MECTPKNTVSWNFHGIHQVAWLNPVSLGVKGCRQLVWFQERPSTGPTCCLTSCAEAFPGKVALSPGISTSFFGPQFLQSLVLVSSYLNYNVDCFLFACAFKSYCYTNNTDADRWESRFSFLCSHLLFRQIFVVTGALKVAVILYFLVCSLER